MTAFGAQIPANRRRPDWLDHEEMIEAEIEGWRFIGKASVFKWTDVASFSLSHDHEFYQQQDDSKAA